MKKTNIFLIIGTVCIITGFMLFAKNIWEDYQVKKTTESVKVKLIKEIKEDTEIQVIDKRPDYVKNPNLEMPIAIIDGLEYIGFLIIPSLNLELPVLNNWSYENLRVAPARFEGSVYLDNITLLAHNNKAHFGNLFYLDKGDLITFKDINNNEFDYTVEKIEELDPIQVEDMVKSDWDLTLFTCTLSGEARFTVRCNKVEKETN